MSTRAGRTVAVVSIGAAVAILGGLLIVKLISTDDISKSLQQMGQTDPMKASDEGNGNISAHVDGTRLEKADPPYPEPVILGRRAWGAAEPAGKMRPHKPTFITIHHTATGQNDSLSIEQKMRNLQYFSQKAARLGDGRRKPPWTDVPYHFYIDLHGHIAEGRDVRFAGDTNTNYDPRGHIGIVLEGNFEYEQPTKTQIASLRSLIRWLAAKYDIPATAVKGHRDYAATVCPGRHLEARLYRLKMELEQGRRDSADRKP